MKKEVFLAITVGFVLGLIITFGIWAANNSLRNRARSITGQNPVPSISVTPTPSQINTSIPLFFTSPVEDETLVSSGTLVVSGKTLPGAIVAIVYENGQNLVTADSQGNFSLDIKLDSGYNRITATVFDKDGNTAKTETLVTYTTSKI